MAHTLKLNIYYFRIREKRERDYVYVKFEDFFKTAFAYEDDPKTISKEKLYQRFTQEYIKSFNDEFVTDKEETKGIAADFLNVEPAKNILDGMINGGLTGIDQNIFSRGNSKKKEDTLDKTKVTALPYYFKLWTPFDADLGAMMFQSYTSMGVNSLIIAHLINFFSARNYILEKNSYVPQEYRDNFKKRSKITKVTFYKAGISEDKRYALNPVFEPYVGLRVKLEFNGLDETPESFWRLFGRDKKKINANLTALEMNDDDDYETVITYKDEFGHESSAKISKKLDIFPTYFLPDDLKEKGKDYANYDLIRQYTNGILNKLKEEIQYAPVLLE